MFFGVHHAFRAFYFLVAKTAIHFYHFFFLFHVIHFFPKILNPVYFWSAFGIATVPSFFWFCSISATSVLLVASAVLLRVCTKPAGATPSFSLYFMFRLRAW